MIYGRDSVEGGLHAIMFPVVLLDIFAETGSGRYYRIAGKKAIANSDSRRVLSVVSDRYRIVENRTALALGLKCCTTAFPNTAEADWSVFSVEAPLSGGHCRIDLEHRGETLSYDWSFSRGTQDRYRPFVRVTNSYNRTRVFSLHFGFVRWACQNGMLDWDSRIRIAVPHDTSEIEKDIERQIDEAKFNRVAEEFRGLLKPLAEIKIPRARFRSIVQSVLEIREPEGMPEDRQLAWRALERAIDHTIEAYIEEMEANAYALANAITDLATRPPVQVCGYCFEREELHGPEHELPDDPRGRPYCFIRRERHTLQRLAGIWLSEFSGGVQQQDFVLQAYIDDPSRDLTAQRVPAGIACITQGSAVVAGARAPHPSRAQFPVRSPGSLRGGVNDPAVRNPARC